MPKKNYTIDLSDKEKIQLLNIVNEGKTNSKRILHANILLAADINNSQNLSTLVIAKNFNVHRQTVQTIRKIYATQGLEAALTRRKRAKPPIESKVTPDVEAQIIAIFCSNPPPGLMRWTLRRVAQEAISLEIVPAISHTTVGRILKKHISNLHLNKIEASHQSSSINTRV